MRTNKLKKNCQYLRQNIKTNNTRHTTVYKAQHSQIRIINNNATKTGNEFGYENRESDPALYLEPVFF